MFIYIGPTWAEYYESFIGFFNYPSEILQINLGTEKLLQMVRQGKTTLCLKISPEKPPRNNNWEISDCLCSFAGQNQLCYLENHKSCWIDYHVAFLEANLLSCCRYVESE